MTLLFEQISKPLHLCAYLLPGNGFWNRFHGVQIVNFPLYYTSYCTSVLTFANSTKRAVVARSASISVV